MQGKYWNNMPDLCSLQASADEKECQLCFVCWIFISVSDYDELKLVMIGNLYVMTKWLGWWFWLHQCLSSPPRAHLTPLLPLLLGSRHELVEYDWFSVHAAASDVDGDVPQRPHPPVQVCGPHQHLGLHLLAVVVVWSSASLTRIVTQDLSDGFWKYLNKSLSFMCENTF